MKHQTLQYSARWLACVGSAVLLIAGCTTAPTGPGTAAATAPACHAVFDAGSSGTRLYFYVQNAKAVGGWDELEGPKVSALADPVREIRGKKNSDLDAVTTEVAGALDLIAKDGPMTSKGKPEWQAYDWSKQCRLASVMIYATAGMRIAEQEKPEQSLALWTTVRNKLQHRVGAGVPVKARTLTGFEEGLYAWLAVRAEVSAKTGADAVGIAEMGGASAQVTFPCPDCDPADDAVRTVTLDGKATRMYSYSFLGLGQDEAPKVLGQPANCAYGVGKTQPGWKKQDCADPIQISVPQGIKDPYNYQGGTLGAYRVIPTSKAAVKDWYLTGAFFYSNDSDIPNCCLTDGKCFEAATACFRPIYLEKFLQTLQVPASSQKMDVSWTQGAVLCEAQQCLKAATPAPVCRWSGKGCLVQP